jgi:hypothetical protein
MKDKDKGKKKGKGPKLVEPPKNVVKLHRDRITPKQVLEAGLEHVDKLDSVILLSIAKNGGLSFLPSHITISEMSLLKDLLQKEILDAMDEITED